MTTDDRLTHRLICRDCLQGIGSLPDDSVNLVFTSPPYENARTYGIKFEHKADAWVEWAIERYMDCLRVCNGLVAWVVQGMTRNYHWSATPMLLAAEIRRRGGVLRSPPIFYRYGIPGSGGPDWLRSDYEFIICATRRRGRLPFSDNLAMGHVPKYAPGGEMSYRNRAGARRNAWGKSPAQAAGNASGPRTKSGKRSHTQRPGDGPVMDVNVGPDYVPPKIANPGNVIKCNVGGGRMGDELCHLNEAPFPERLAEFFIRSFCPPGGVVLDPFCGSGTTLKMAAAWGRSSIGIDVRPNQIALSRRRTKLGHIIRIEREKGCKKIEDHGVD